MDRAPATTQNPPNSPASEGATHQQLATAIAGQLGETEPGPMNILRRIISTLGPERTQELLAETLHIEAQGGQLLPDGSRRRTPGGIFFRLAKAQIPGKTRWYVFRTKPPTTPPAPTTPAAQLFTWDDFAASAAALDTARGEATSVKITVIGRPAQILERGDVTIIALRNEKAPTLPKGLPSPATPTDYAVLITRKQWLKVAQAATNPADLLIVEGFPTVDPRFNGITVLATNTTTKQLQQAERLRRQTAATQG